MAKKLCLLGLVALIAAGCGGSGNDGPPQIGTDACSIDGQKQFVLDAMRDVYFWNSSLPASVNLANFATPEALLEYLKSFSPISSKTGEPVDRFSFITTVEQDQQFFGEGKFEGFGFRWRAVPSIDAIDAIQFEIVYSGSPADGAGFQRGEQIFALDGRSIADIDANEGISAAFDASPLTFSIRRLDGSTYDATVTKAIVTIDPLPQWRVIDRQDGTSVGYIEFTNFFSTAEPVFATIFNEFRQAGITDLIIDMRYNGGGLVATAELLGDYLGGRVSNNLVFSKTLFNANNSQYNSIRNFRMLTDSLNLSQLVIIATESTASASELVINSMEPHVAVAIVGGTTYGKPVGQVGLEFCQKLLRATAFETVNSLDEGQYYDGLPVDCASIDDPTIPVGDDTDPNLVTALSYLQNGACPTAAQPAAFSKALLQRFDQPIPDWSGPPQRVYSRAY